MRSLKSARFAISRCLTISLLPAACAAGTGGVGQRAATANDGSRAQVRGTDASSGAASGAPKGVDAGRTPFVPEPALDASSEFLRALESGFPAARKLAKSSGQQAAEQASVVLYALADAIQSSAGASKRVAEQLTEVRFEAKRLHRSDRLSFSLARWIREGLTAATSALEALGAQGDVSIFWIAQARASIAAIDTKSGLTFQRAVVQDAIRATLDAFAAFGRVHPP